MKFTAIVLLFAVLLLPASSWQMVTLGNFIEQEQLALNDSISYFDGSEWTMFKHDLRHTGFSTSTAPNISSVAWHFPLNRSIVWLTSPTVANGRVFVGTKGPPGVLLAIDQFTGRILWSFEVPDSLRTSSMAVSGRMVYFGAWDRNVYALNETDGSLVWKFTTAGRVGSSPAVANGTVYIGSWDGNTYALDQSNGSLKWRFATDGLVISSPAIADGLVFTGGGPNLYALDLATGRLLWKFQTNAVVVASSPLVRDGVVYTGPDDGNVYALDALSGNLVWMTATASPTSGVELVSSPTSAYGKVYVCSWDSALYALDPANGAILWKTASVCNIEASPAAADNKVFTVVGTVASGARLVALDASSGSVLWQTTQIFPHDYWVSPTIADGMVFTAGGEVAAFGTPNLRRTFELDWSDYDNNGMIDIVDVANTATAFDRFHLYWDLNLNNNTDITDIATVAFYFGRSFPDPQSYPGRGYPAGTMDPRWKDLCILLPEPHRSYCQTRI